MNTSTTNYSYQKIVSPTSLRTFIMRVYAFMMAGLVVTGAVSYGVFTEQTFFMTLISSRLYLYGLLGLQLGLALILSAAITRLSTAVCTALFFLYSATLGLSLSVIFAVYQLGSIVSIFFLAAAMFGGMALYGYFTKADLTTFGSIMRMALFGLIIASLVNLFIQSSAFGYLLSYLGVLIFAGLTAYDMQIIKETGLMLIAHGEPMHKAVIVGALTLYLDFINLFLRLLELLGKRRD